MLHGTCAGRHDTPEEKLNDEIRAKINASHRFESFAGQRQENAIKWYVDPGLCVCCSGGTEPVRFSRIG